jgi:galactoside O-acetyltransferase
MITGIDVRISDRAEITRPDLVTIGDHVAIDTGVYLSTSARLGDYIHIAPQVCIIGGSDALFIMEDFTNISIGARVIIITDDFKRGMLNPIVPVKYRHLIGDKIIMRKFSAIGAGSIVLPNVEMAEGSVLGAGSLLTRSTIPWMIYVGSPARAVKMRDKTLILQAYREMGYDKV